MDENSDRTSPWIGIINATLFQFFFSVFENFFEELFNLFIFFQFL